jgi:hypothetical protein
VALPALTRDERSRASAQAEEDRATRSELLTSLHSGATTLPQVLGTAQTDNVAGKTKVAQLLKALPGFGPTRVTRLLEQAGVDIDGRAAGLGDLQRTKLAEGLES